jgi:hypothetical protein
MTRYHLSTWILVVAGLTILATAARTADAAVTAANHDQTGLAPPPHRQRLPRRLVPKRGGWSQQKRRKVPASSLPWSGVETPREGAENCATARTVLPRGGGAAIAVADPTLARALAGAVAFAMIEQIVKRGLQLIQFKYPAGLGACILLFTSLCLTDLVAPSMAQQWYEALAPGAALLAQWFPVFFVPGLALLPLSPSIGGTVDVSTWLVRPEENRCRCCLFS